MVHLQGRQDVRQLAFEVHIYHGSNDLRWGGTVSSATATRKASMPPQCARPHRLHCPHSRCRRRRGLCRRRKAAQALQAAGLGRARAQHLAGRRDRPARRAEGLRARAGKPQGRCGCCPPRPQHAGQIAVSTQSACCRNTPGTLLVPSKFQLQPKKKSECLRAGMPDQSQINAGLAQACPLMRTRSEALQRSIVPMPAENA